MLITGFPLFGLLLSLGGVCDSEGTAVCIVLSNNPQPFFPVALPRMRVVNSRVQTRQETPLACTGLCVFGGSQLRRFCLSPCRVCGDAAEASDVSSGWLFGSSFQPQSSSSRCQPVPLALLHVPGAGTGTSRALLCGFVGHLGLWFAGMRRNLSSQVSAAWEQVNRNARLIILKCCGHQNGALAGGNWKMCHLLFDFLMSLLQFTEYKG